MSKSCLLISTLIPLLCLGGNLLAKDLKIEKIRDSVIDPQALHFTNGTWGLCVNGQTFQQDAVVTFKDFQYATYYDANRQLCVARRKSSSTDWEIIRFTDYHFKGNDTHNVTVIGICPRDGTIHLSFDHHGHPLHYRVSKPGVALRPKEFSWKADLFGEITSDLEPGKKLLRVTYPRFLRTPNGSLQFGCRIGGSGNGEKYLADYDGVSGIWKNFGVYAGSAGVYENSKERNPYLNGLNYDRKGRLHVTWCWRETGDPMTNHDLNYAWSDDLGVTWLNNAGKKVGVRGQPFTLESDVCIAKIGMKRGLINATTQAVDKHNRIHFVTFHLPDDVPSQTTWDATRPKTHYFHYWRDDHGQWHHNEMNFVGGRPQLWLDEKENAYLVFTGDRFNPSPNLSIAAANAKNGWKDWKVIHAEHGPFSSQPQLDRYGKPGVMSVYIQESPKAEKGTASALRIIDYSPK